MPLQTPGFFTIFALVAPIVWGIMIASRTRALENNGTVTAGERSTFLRATALVLFAGFGPLGITAAVAWFRHDACWTPSTMPRPVTWALATGTLVFWIWVLRWLWQEGGDEVLARFSPALLNGGLTRPPYSPRKVRFVASLVGAVAALGTILTLVVPPGPSFRLPGCS